MSELKIINSIYFLIKKLELEFSIMSHVTTVTVTHHNKT